MKNIFGWIVAAVGASVVATIGATALCKNSERINDSFCKIKERNRKSKESK